MKQLEDIPVVVRLMLLPTLILFAWLISDRQIKEPLSVAEWMVDISQDKNYLASIDTENYVCIWNVNTGKIHRRFFAGNKPMLAIAYGPEEKRMFMSTTEGELIVYKIANGERLHSIKDGTSKLWSIVVRDDKFLTFGEDGVLNIYDSNTYEKINSIATNTVGGKSLAVTHNAKIGLVATAEGKGLLIDLEQGQIKQVYKNKAVSKAGKHNFVEARISPDNSYGALTGVGGIVHLINLDSGEEINQINAFKGFASTLSFAPNGTQIAVGSIQGDIRVFDLKTGKLLHEINQKVEDGIQVFCKYMHDSQQLITCGRQIPIRIWDTTTGELIQEIAPSSLNA